MTHQQLLVSLQLLLPITGAALSGSLAHAQAAPAPPTSAVSNINGQIAFFLSGQEKTQAGGTDLIAIAGSVTTDGNGNITAGVLDKNSASGVVQTQTVRGTYQLDTTGKGSFNLSTPQGNFSFTFYTALPFVPYGLQGTIVAGGGPVLNASGELGQDDSSFSLNGGEATYAFSEDGELAAGTSPVKGSGTLTFTEVASSVAGTSAVTIAASGLLVSNGVVTSFSGLNGTYTGPYVTVNGLPIGDNGRFRIALPSFADPSTMANYVVYSGYFPSGSLFFLSVDPHPASAFTVGTNVRAQGLITPPL